MVAPFPVTFTVKDYAGAVLANAKVLVRNCTKKTTSAEATTDAGGIAVVDLANLPLARNQTNSYDTGDSLLLIAYKGAQHDAVKYTVAGGSKALTLQMNDICFCGKDAPSSVRIDSLCVANDAGASGIITVYSVDDGEVIARVTVPANDTRSHYFGTHGRRAGLGIVCERSATTMHPTANQR